MRFVRAHVRKVIVELTLAFHELAASEQDYPKLSYTNFMQFMSLTGAITPDRPAQDSSLSEVDNTKSRGKSSMSLTTDPSKA